MAIVQLRSTNPQFSFLIKKNPGTGMQLREVRQGMAYGWYSDETTFNVYFKDADNEISYKQQADESFEYLNVSRYNTPLFPLNAITEFFQNAVKAQDERDTEGFEHRFYINMVHIDRVRYIDFFAKHLNEFTFSLQHQAHKSYSLTVSTRKSLHHLLHAAGLLTLFLAIFGEEYIDISDAVLDKYIRSLNIIDPPFYIRSLFARNFLNSRERFKKYKADIERTDRYAIRLEYGGTGLQRRNFITRLISFDKPILDVGCGEGFYAFALAPKLEGLYYAVDVNEELLEAVSRKAEAKELDNIATFRSLDHFLEIYNGERVDVILTEVIEHMSEDEAGALVRQICGNVDFEQFIVTTPNADFNDFYELNGFRHEDHKWEMGEQAFQKWIAEIVQHDKVSYEVLAIGDSVNGIHTTQGVLIRRKEG
ncbi:methyltransferase domain-containing protein [Paenibacillus koleovorans]|uniref:methyltransferase domain-containing protein n=1 Tax=Paenibacillus koleovorans TaxID=121608 RepID=UPI000FD7342E|nr:methyltransferase domain-containing protein [Paenibacillus koleovorans]